MDYNQSYQSWLQADELSDKDRERLLSLTEKEKEEQFYCPLQFGTAGMRGVLDVGTNRMNIFTVKRATQGLAEFIKTLGSEAMQRGVVISYDTRRCSSEFAIRVARVLAYNGINAYLFDSVHPVPMCSFAIRELNAIAAVMITASHNPKSYNGYKVYGEDGAQMSPESTDKVVNYIDKTPYFGICEVDVDMSAESIRGLDNARLHPHITIIGRSVDEKYFDTLQALSLSAEQVKTYGKNVKLVYTPIHGSGYMPVTTILSRMGITVNVVEEQAAADTEFSTVRVPNPEEADTLKMGVELADKIGSDVVIGTDPDADRMGIAIRNSEGKFVLLNGNQIGVLMLNYILLRKKQSGTLPQNGAIVKTIVTTELARALAASYGVVTYDVLTGFKFIGEKIKEWEQSGEHTYLFGFEESYGSLVGTHARDKDAVVAAMTFAEMVCYFDSVGKKIYDVLEDIYRTFGYYVEKAKAITFSGLDGMQKMADIMTKIRSTSFDNIQGVKVLAQSDFVSRTRTNADGTTESIELPKTNAFKLHLENGDWICVRPSGTEPKLKFYVAASAREREAATQKADAYIKFMENLVNEA